LNRVRAQRLRAGVASGTGDCRCGVVAGKMSQKPPRAMPVFSIAAATRGESTVG
jgi:hypothetical protein